MYDRDQPLIEAAMRASVYGFKRGVMFAVCSMRVQITRVPDHLDAVFDGQHLDEILWGHKAHAFRYLEANADLLWQQCTEAHDAATVILRLCDMPGMGIVKAAFVAQMLGHDVACLDARNIERKGLNPREFRSDGITTGAPRLRKVGRYIRRTKGKARQYWNEWCDYVGADYGLTGDVVSALHVCIAKPEAVALEDTF